LNPLEDERKPTRGRICFYSPFLYPVAVEGSFEFVGGTEVRQWALARGLAERGFDVSIVTCDFGQDARVEREGVELLSAYSLDHGLPGVRLFYPRLWKAMKALHSANADVYLANGSGIPVGWAYHAARIRGAGFVFLASSDRDAEPSLPWLTKRREKWWYLQGLRGADARIAQTEFQQRLFRRNFGLDTEVIPNPVEPIASPVDPGANACVLWLSTYKPTKRPEWFTELARRLPEIRFVMAGYPGYGGKLDSWHAAQHVAADTSNLEVHGLVDRTRVAQLLREAAIFVHTSPAEGFPMTLLEAWSAGIPTITAVDPGGTIETHGLGQVADSVDELVGAVDELMAAPERRRAIGAHAREYVDRHHGPEKSYEPLASLLDRIIQTT
jgi:glycosyltransferase involved in cell wall biosynthesis